MALLHLAFDLDPDVYPELHAALSLIASDSGRGERFRQLAATGLVWEKVRIHGQPVSLSVALAALEQAEAEAAAQAALDGTGAVHEVSAEAGASAPARAVDEADGVGERADGLVDGVTGERTAESAEEHPEEHPETRTEASPAWPVAAPAETAAAPAVRQPSFHAASSDAFLPDPFLPDASRPDTPHPVDPVTLREATPIAEPSNFVDLAIDAALSPAYGPEEFETPMAFERAVEEVVEHAVRDVPVLHDVVEPEALSHAPHAPHAPPAVWPSAHLLPARPAFSGVGSLRPDYLQPVPPSPVPAAAASEAAEPVEAAADATAASPEDAAPGGLERRPATRSRLQRMKEKGLFKNG